MVNFFLYILFYFNKHNGYKIYMEQIQQVIKQMIHTSEQELDGFLNQSIIKTFKRQETESNYFTGKINMQVPNPYFTCAGFSKMKL